MPQWWRCLPITLDAKPKPTPITCVFHITIMTALLSTLLDLKHLAGDSLGESRPIQKRPVEPTEDSGSWSRCVHYLGVVWVWTLAPVWCVVGWSLQCDIWPTYSLKASAQGVNKINNTECQGTGGNKDINYLKYLLLKRGLCCYSEADL